MTNLAKITAEKLQKALPQTIECLFEDGRGMIVRTDAKHILEVLSFLKSDSDAPFNMLVDETAVDFSTWGQETGLAQPSARFLVVYNLYSVSKQTRLFVEVPLSDGEEISSAVSLYHSANWAEREIFDMFGIRFSKHPDLRRILMPEDTPYFPMRKEFPLQGLNPQDYPQE